MSCNYHSWSAHIKSFLRSVLHAMKHLEGTYDKKHPKWSCSLNDALINALHGTIDTTGEHNVNYLILDVIKEYLTFNQVWRKIENGLTNKATKMSHRLALISQLNNTKMFQSDVRKLIQEIWSIQTESSLLGKHSLMIHCSRLCRNARSGIRCTRRRLPPSIKSISTPLPPH